jgi:hypothetical protein
MILSSRPHLDRWHNIVFKRDRQDLQAMLAENVVFRSPYLWQPYHGRQAARLIRTTVSEVFIRPANDLKALGLEMARRLR